MHVPGTIGFRPALKRLLGLETVGFGFGLVDSESALFIVDPLA